MTAYMNNKINIYRMPLSRVFPVKHPRAGELTHFEYKIKKALGISCVGRNCEPKLHTIRNRPEYWQPRIEAVQQGKAVLVLYGWNGKPYRKEGATNLFVFGTSATKAFIDELLSTERYASATPVIDSGIGVQEIMLDLEDLGNPHNLTCVVPPDRFILPSSYISPAAIATNDGLSPDDFKAWFKGYDLSKPKAIIQFTKFRY
jgi:hypothetical protein